MIFISKGMLFMEIQNRLLADKEKDSKLGAWSDKHDTLFYLFIMCRGL